jgi:hypothetical protein
VTIRYFGTLHLVPRGWDPDADDADDEVVESFEHGRSHLKVASELWGLFAPARAARIDELVSAAFRRHPPLWERPQIVELLGLLDGLEEGLVRSGVTDASLSVPPERLPELKRRTTMFEIDEGEGAVPESAVVAALTRVGIAREILEAARDRGLSVVLD